MSNLNELMKPTLLLATAIFLMVAPAPDARDITEMTAGFIVPDQQVNLLADDQAPVREQNQG